MRGNRKQCRILKRCLIFFVSIGLLPLALVYLVTSEQDFRNKNYDIENDTQYQAISLEQFSHTLSQSEMENIELQMVHRTEHLNDKCSQFGLDIPGNDSLHKPNPWEFLINKQYHIVWCNVFKAASTSWMYNFNLLAGYSPQFLKKTNVVALSLARKRYPRPSVVDLRNALNNSISFLIVRHPFERLLSAYRDKIQFALPQTFHQKLSHQIIRKYRKNKYGKGNTRWASFSEFVSFLIDEIKNKKVLDMHWTPITSFCTPCQVKFDIIAKFETLKDDQRYLIEKAGLHHQIAPQWKNSGKGKNTIDLVMKYYAQLTPNQIQELYQLYKYDFELFDYSPKEYFNVAEITTTTTTLLSNHFN